MEMQLNVNPWNCVAGNNIFWLLCHQFPHTHFTKHDTASWHVCSTATTTNTSLIDPVKTVIVLI